MKNYTEEMLLGLKGKSPFGDSVAGGLIQGVDLTEEWCRSFRFIECVFIDCKIGPDILIKKRTYFAHCTFSGNKAWGECSHWWGHCSDKVKFDAFTVDGFRVERAPERVLVFDRSGRAYHMDAFFLTESVHKSFDYWLSLTLEQLSILLLEFGKEHIDCLTFTIHFQSILTQMRDRISIEKSRKP